MESGIEAPGAQTVPGVRPASAAGAARRPLVRRLHVLMALARSDLQIRYGRGAWQIVKWVVDPFALVGVYLLVRIILGRGGEQAALSLACAVVPFQIVLMGCISAMSGISAREPILLNMSFDRMLIPAAAVMTETLAFAASFLMFPIAMAAYGVEPTAALVWLPLVVVVTLLLAFAAAWPAALLGLWFPALKMLTMQALRLLFFAAPGLVALAEVTDDVRDWIVFNPFTGLFEAFRHVIMYGTAPQFWHLAYPAGTALLLCAVFVPLYRREQRHFGKLLGEAGG